MLSADMGDGTFRGEDVSPLDEFDRHPNKHSGFCPEHAADEARIEEAMGTGMVPCRYEPFREGETHRDTGVRRLPTEPPV